MIKETLIDLRQLGLKDGEFRMGLIIMGMVFYVERIGDEYYCDFF